MSNLFETFNLCKKYGSFLALNNVNISLQPGQITGLLGPNGSGKTTLIKIINGLLTPSSGEVRILGMQPGPETKAHVSYLPERTYLNDYMQVRDILDFFEDFYADFNKAKALEMLQRLQIAPNRRLKTLSKGTKEKVQLILVMSRAAALYCLDEPIGGVDPAARDYILETIINNYCENAAVLISTHLIYDIENVLDQVIFLQNGCVREMISVDAIREIHQKSVDAYFREVFRC